MALLNKTNFTLLLITTKCAVFPPGGRRQDPVVLLLYKRVGDRADPPHVHGTDVGGARGRRGEGAACRGEDSNTLGTANRQGGSALIQR